MISTPDRRLAAIMVADVAGFSRLMEMAESQTFVRMRRVREEIANPKVAEFGGRVIKSTGDGFLAEFVSAIAALRCGIDIQRSVIVLEADQPTESRIRLRIGINVGDIIIDGTDIAGDGVNIAARLEAMSPVDGICISSMVHDQIRDDLGLVFEDLGQLHLKNISRPVQAFTVNVGGRDFEKYSGFSDANEAARIDISVGTSLPQKAKRFANFKQVNAAIALAICSAIILAALGWYWRVSQNAKVSLPNSISAPQRSALSIMVLPFTNGTGNPQQAYIADGLTASLTSDLSRIRDAFVVAAATAFTYKDNPVTLEQVRKDLGVRFVLHGNVQRNGDKLRINAQLADASSSAQLWAESFDGEQADLFALQDKVTTRIANSIGREMVIVAARDSETRKSAPEAVDLLLRARALNLKPQSLKNFQEIEEYYRRALVLDPSNTSAMVGLANILTLQANNFGTALDEIVWENKYVEGLGFAVKAKELDPDNPGVYLPIALYAFAHDDYPGSRRANESALSLQPKSAAAHVNYATSLIFGGEPQRAIEVLNQAVSIDPTFSQDGIWFSMGWANFMTGDNDAAIDWLLKSLGKNSARPVTYAFLTMAYTLKGEDAKARALVADLHRVAPKFKLSKLQKPNRSSTAAYKEYYEKKLHPTWSKAGLPE